MSELDDLRQELTDLRATMNAGFLATDRHIRRQHAADLRQREREAEALLNAAPLAGRRWHTRQGSYIESEAVPATPLLDRLRSDYAFPAGTLDRLALATVGQLDTDNALELFFQLPGTVYDVYECYIGIALRQFYATAKAAVSGGSSAPTSGSSSSSSSGPSSASTTGPSNTSSSGASSSSSSGASSSTTTGASDTSSSSNNAAASSATTTTNNAQGSSDNTTGADNTAHRHDWAAYASATPGGYSTRRYAFYNSGGSTGGFVDLPTSTNGPDLYTSSGSANHTHGMAHTHSHSHGMTHTHAHSHNIDHTHTMPHTHGISHTHQILHTHDIPHTHDIDHTHTVTIAAHAHDLDFGIFKETMPASWSVKVRLYEAVASVWTLRYTSDAITELVDEVDLSAYVTGAGMWLVTLQSDAAQPNNGRLSAQLFGTVVGAIRTA